MGVSDILTQFTSFVSQYGYIAIGGMVFLECSAFLGLFVPGETFVVLGGLFASQGSLNLFYLWIVAVIGGYLGDVVGYMIGYRFGESVVKKIGSRFGYKEKHFQQTHEFFEKWGAWAIIAGRFMSLFRSLLPATIGTVKYHKNKFFLFDAIGTSLWVTTFVALGYFFGNSWSLVEKYIPYFVAGGFVLGFVVVYFLMRKKKVKSPSSL